MSFIVTWHTGNHYLREVTADGCGDWVPDIAEARTFPEFDDAVQYAEPWLDRAPHLIRIQFVANA